MNRKIKTWHPEWQTLIPILLLALIFILTLLGTNFGWELTVQKMENDLSEELEHHTVELYDELERQFAILEGYGASFTQESIDNHDALMKTLERFVNSTEFSYVCFAYPDSTLYRNDGVQVQVPERFYFQQSMQGERVAEFLVNSEIDPKPRIGLAVPVVLDGKVEGVLLGLYEKEIFRSLLERMLSNVSMLAYICDSTGKLIIGTEEAEIFLATHDLQIAENDSLMEILEDSVFSVGSKAQVEEMMRNYESGQAVYEYQGDMHHTTFVPLQVNDWYVVAVLHESEIYEETLGMVGIFYALIFLAMSVVLLIIVYLLFRERRLALKEKKKAEEARYRLEHDDLTGVLAEKAFLEQVNARLAGIQPEEYCLVYLDVYKFKLINEMFGYTKGNELLCAMGQELEKFARNENGLCGRISGDSFVLFLPHTEKIVSEFYTKKYRDHRVVPLDLYLHYGIYVIKDTSIPVNLMIDAAKLAQKTVKGNYDNCLAYYDERIKQQLMKEQDIITSMAKALSDEEFIVYLQPQYNYRNGAICGAEALVRWDSPAKGLISPGDFIPIFETNGFIILLDEYVWEQVCKLQRKWLDEGKAILPISVNISRADLLKGGIADKLTKLIQKYNLSPNMLRVEITESAYMDNPQQLISEINKLAECGFVVEMDDFGSGYSSLNMLKDVPFHVLKTDLKFLSDTGSESRKNRILANIIRMAHEMGMFVIAEGVETKEQADYLFDLGCDQMQGYYFSKPVPVEQYEKMVYPDDMSVDDADT